MGRSKNSLLKVFVFFVCLFVIPVSVISFPRGARGEEIDCSAIISSTALPTIKEASQEAEVEDFFETFKAGYCHAVFGDPSKAAFYLDGLEKSLPEIKEHVFYYSSFAHLKAGHWERSAAQGEKALRGNPSDGLKNRIYNVLADAYFNMGNNAKALKYYKKLSDHYLRPEQVSLALFRTGESLETSGDMDGAARSFKKLWVELPESELAAMALSKAEMLSKEHRVRFQKTESDYRKRAQRLYKLRFWEAAYENYERVYQSDDELVDMAVCKYFLREYGDSLRLLGKVESARADWWKSRVDLKLGREGAAIGHFGDIHSRFPKSALAPAGLFKAGRLSEINGNLSAARGFYKLLIRKYPGDEKASEARFHLGWIEYRLGNYSLALRDFKIGQSSKAMYWRARTLEKLGRDDRAKEIFEQLGKELTPSYYGYLARSRSGVEPGFVKVGNADGRFELAVVRNHKRVNKAILLTGLGLYEDARDELDDLAMRIRSSKGRLELSYLSCKAEDFYTSIKLASGMDGQSALALSYPMGNRGSVSRHLGDFEVDEGHIYSIMREESRFQPEIVSTAGAIGLMQIIPPTAKATAKALGIGAFETSMLYNPRTNILLGMAYFKKVLDEFGGNSTYAIASYNAGPHNVASWKRRNGHLDDDEFVEEIPFLETRRYVKRVLRSYGVYASLYKTTDGFDCP